MNIFNLTGADDIHHNLSITNCSDNAAKNILFDSENYLTAISFTSNHTQLSNKWYERRTNKIVYFINGDFARGVMETYGERVGNGNGARKLHVACYKTWVYHAANMRTSF